MLLQIKIAGENRLNVATLGVLLHRVTQFDDAAELITAAIFCIGQQELRVVLSGHVTNLRLQE